jgi:hypothetical protein
MSGMPDKSSSELRRFFAPTKKQSGCPMSPNTSTQWQSAAAAVCGELLYNPGRFGTSHVNGLQSFIFLPSMYLSTGYDPILPWNQTTSHVHDQVQSDFEPIQRRGKF